MLTQIKLKNFKIFKEETAFPLAKINLLTGINGRGKSSLLQALLLMRQSIEQDENTSQIYLNGSCVRLGEVEDVRSTGTTPDTEIMIGFLFKRNKDVNTPLELNYHLKDATNNIRCFGIESVDLEVFANSLPNPFESKKTKKISVEKDYENHRFYHIQPTETEEPNVNQYRFQNLVPKLYFNNLTKSGIFQDGYEMSVYSENNFKEIHYISADRIAPKDFYLKENLGEFINVGAKGEMIANVIAHKKDELVNDILYLGEDAKTLEQQIQEWLKAIFGEAKFKIEDKGDIIYLYFNTKNDGNWYKPSNVGFGFSYVLPIIVSGLIAKEGEILIVENPEAHLHPRAQSKLTEFLSKVASTGVQVFIESHSEHILNGLRIVAINQDINISNEDISVLYFHEKEEGYFTQIPIKPNGKIEKWEEGFFDQAEHDLDILLGI